MHPDFPIPDVIGDAFRINFDRIRYLLPFGNNFLIRLNSQVAVELKAAIIACEARASRFRIFLSGVFL